jgi:hypothetical protein
VPLLVSFKFGLLDGVTLLETVQFHRVAPAALIVVELDLARLELANDRVAAPLALSATLEANGGV